MGQWRRVAGCVALCAMGAPLLSQMSIADALLARERGSLVAVNGTDADSGVARPAATLEAALRAASASAGVIFTGEVLSVDRTPGAVMVRWRVEEAVAGVTAGAVYVQKEWPGLWVDGNARYQVGERALVLLHAPSVGGFASPVGDGVIPLRGDTITGTLDLRWLAQGVAVTDPARLSPMRALRAAGGDLALGDALLRRAAGTASVPRTRGLVSLPSTDGNETRDGVVIVPTAAGALPNDANAHVDGAMILGMLHAWQHAGKAGR